MKLRFSFFLSIAFAVLVFSSCNKSNKIGRYIPKEASFIVHMNGGSLTSKLPWEELKKNELFQEIYADSSLDAVMKSAFDNPENTGIDINNDLVFFIQKDSAGGYIALQGKIKDADKFKNFYSTATKGTVVPGKNEASSISNSKMSAIWNKERFSIIFDVPAMRELNMNNMRVPGMDSTMAEAPQPLINRDLPALANLVFDLEEKSSLAKEEKFTELLNVKGDIHFWINAGDLGSQAGSMGAMGGMGMMNMAKLYEGSIVTGTATFLDGKIEMNMKSYAGKQMTDLFKKYEGSKISSDLIKRVPSKDIAVLFAMNFKPQGLLEFLKLAGIDGFANMGAGMLGFSLEDFVNGNKGDIILTISDLKKDSSEKADANFLFSAAINDKAAFNKLIEAGKKAGQSKLSDSLPRAIFYNATDKYFVIGNKQAAVDTYLKTESNHSFDFYDKISGSPVGLFVNFQYVMRAMAPVSSDSLKMATYNASVQMWDNMIASGGEFKDGGIIQKVELNLVDKNMNSLKQLNNYFGILGAVEKKKKAAMKGMWYDSTNIKVDSTIAFSPVN